MIIIIVTGFGFFLLWALLRVARFFPRISRAAICYSFIGLWAVLTATITTIGALAGHPVWLEALVFLITFSIPAYVALRRRQAPDATGKWGRTDIPSQGGMHAVITGATGGIGFETALALAAAGADVVIAARNEAKGRDAIKRIKGHVPEAKVRFELLDLASIASVRAFAERLVAQKRPLDMLINNAAVMNPPERIETEDGFELQFATNYLGHFALTGLLLPLLRQAERPRVVTLSSVAARSGAINFDDLQADHGYKPMTAYAQSKLACLMFAFELQRRSDAAGWGVRSVAAHPGISRTDLLHNASGPWSAAGMARTFLWFLFQPVAQGALPGLFAATAPAVEGGGYYGPARLGETRGHPKAAIPPAQSLGAETAERLWTVSEQLTGTRYR